MPPPPSRESINAERQPLLPQADKLIAFEDYLYEAFYLARIAETHSIGVDIHHFIQTYLYCGFCGTREVDLENNTQSVSQRGKPKDPTTAQRWVKYFLLCAAVGLGGLAAWLYILPSAAAAEMLVGYSWLKWSEPFLKPLISWDGPIANSLLSTEVFLNITKVFTELRSDAEKTITGDKTNWSNWILGGVSVLWAGGGLTPLLQMNVSSATSSAEKIHAYVGSGANFPSFLYGSYMGLGKLYTRLKKWQYPPTPLANLREALAIHLEGELQILLREEKQIVQNEIDTYLDLLRDNNSLKEILPRLLTLSRLRENSTIENHMAVASYSHNLLFGTLIVLRMISLVGFAGEAYKAGHSFVDKDSEKIKILVGILSTLLTFTAQFGLSINSIITITAGILTKQTPLEKDQHPYIYTLAFSVASLIALFSGGTSAKAAAESLKEWGEVRYLFEGVSYFTTGIVVNGFFVLQLFKRLMNYYYSEYGEKKERQLTLFVAGHKNLVGMLRKLDDNTIWRLFLELPAEMQAAFLQAYQKNPATPEKPGLNLPTREELDPQRHFSRVTASSVHIRMSEEV